MTPFEVMDCALLPRMSGIPPAINLRELRDRIAVCTEDVLYHHFCEMTLRPTFDNPDYRNDFAVWAKLYLGDRVLAERLGIIDPYSFHALEELRGAILEVLDERLGETAMVPWARPGDEFFFIESNIVVFNTGVRIPSPSRLAASIRKMTNSSVYFHFLEARRRPPAGRDDFSIWLLECGEEYRPCVDALAGIDFYFNSLSYLRREIARVLACTKEVK